MNLRNFFLPRTITVIGVSRSKKKLGSRVYKNIQTGGFRGRLIPVNPNIEEFDGQRCYPSVRNISGQVDMAVIVTPAKTVAAIIEECGRARVKNCLVISSGFKETGPAGEVLEQELIKLAGKYSLNLLGPNCLGFLHGDNRINASFSHALGTGGNLALITQSGALAAAITDWGRQRKLQFRSVVSLGNDAGLSETDFLEYFRRDKKTQAVVLYLESIKNGPDFLEAAKRTVPVKPVIVLKAGLSELGQRAARSHTGALASSREVTLAALKSAGIIVAADIEELYDLAVVFSAGRRFRGNNLAIVTNAGGPAIMATDAVAQTKLTLPPVANTAAKLKRFLPSSASLANPFDLIGDADELRYRRALSLLVADSGIDGLLAILTPQVVTKPKEIAETIVRLQRRYPDKPFIAAFLGGQSVAGAKAVFQDNNLPYYDYPENAVRMFDRMLEYEIVRRFKYRRSIYPRLRFLSRAHLTADGMLLSPATQSLLKRFGFRLAPQKVVHNTAEALRAARTLGYPLALKLLSHSVIHKSKKQAIWLNIADRSQLINRLRQAERRFPISYRHKSDEGWLLQSMIAGRREWFLGGKRDRTFGPAILVGTGGTEIETEGRVITLMPPFTVQGVRRQLETSSLANMIENKTPGRIVDRTALYQAVVQLGQLMLAYPELQEVDINPFLLGAPNQGGVVVDARAVFSKMP